MMHLAADRFAADQARWKLSSAAALRPRFCSRRLACCGQLGLLISRALGASWERSMN